MKTYQMPKYIEFVNSALVCKPSGDILFITIFEPY